MKLCIIDCRKLSSTKPTDHEGLKCAIDHILDAQKKGEINEDNVLYIVENINVAGKFPTRYCRRYEVVWFLKYYYICALPYMPIFIFSNIAIHKGILVLKSIGIIIINCYY